jgi:hypothetical protein
MLKDKRDFGGTYLLRLQGRICRVSYQRDSMWQFGLENGGDIFLAQ